MTMIKNPESGLRLFSSFERKKKTSSLGSPVDNIQINYLHVTTVSSIFVSSSKTETSNLGKTGDLYSTNPFYIAAALKGRDESTPETLSREL